MEQLEVGDYCQIKTPYICPDIYLVTKVDTVDKIYHCRRAGGYGYGRGFTFYQKTSSRPYQFADVIPITESTRTALTAERAEATRQIQRLSAVLNNVSFED